MKKILFISVLLIPPLLVIFSKNEEITPPRVKITNEISPKEAQPLAQEDEDPEEIKNTSSTSPIVEKKRNIPEEKVPEANDEKKKSTSTASVNKKIDPRRFRRRRNSPPTVTSPGTDRKNNDGSGVDKSTRSGGGTPTGVPMIPSSGKVIEVSETGEGNTMLLQEALRHLGPGDQIHLQKGHYAPLFNHLTLPSFELRGEGPESIIEINEGLKVFQYDLKLKDLKIIHSGTGAIIENRNGKGLILDNVLLQGNGNDGIRIDGGKLQMDKIEMQNFNRAISLKNPVSFSGNGIQITGASYGISFEANKNLSVQGLKTEGIDLFSVFFPPNSSGNLDCRRCSLGDNSTNRKDRLKLIQE